MNGLHAEPAIALVELSSIAAGVLTCDAMLKEARVRLVEAKPVSPGKYIILVAGDEASAESSYRRGLDVGGDAVLDHLFIPNLHPQVLATISGGTRLDAFDSAGVIETTTVAATILAADAAAKTAPVILAEIRLAIGLGGKAFVVMSGDVADVEASVAAGVAAVPKAEHVVRHVVIPNPHEDLNRFML
jgi:microcompartment protein CcmL/EutN